MVDVTTAGELFDNLPSPTFAMREPCRKCGSNRGRIAPRGSQDCVFCECGAFQYNAPKTETGRAPVTVTAAHEAIKPRQRARILLRDGRACVICHRIDRPLHVGHLLSVDAGLSVGLTIRELNDDCNLAAMCDACNLGLGNEPVPLRICAAILSLTLKGMQK